MSLPTSTSIPVPSSGTTRRLLLLKRFENSRVQNQASTPTISVAQTTQNVPNVSVKDGEAKTSMLPPPAPPPLPSSVSSGGETSSTGAGSNMRKLLEDLHRSRLSFEQDQNSLEKARRDLKETDTKIAKLMGNINKANEKFSKLVEVAASKRTELNAVEIRYKVTDETLANAEQELSQVLDELHKIRLQTSELSSSYLAETIQFGLEWNGTELGRESRIQFEKQEMENLERQKRQLEFELNDFLVLQKGVEKSEKEVRDLSQKYKEHNESVDKQETELLNRIAELDTTLKELENEEKEFQRSSFEEMEQLQKQIDDIQNSINSLQSQSSEAKAAVKTQKSSNKKSQNSESNLEARNQQPASISRVPEVTLNDDSSSVSHNLNQIPFENKARSTRFQVPIKPQPQMQTQNSNGVEKDVGKNENSLNSAYFAHDECGMDTGFSSDMGSNSNSNDEDMCLAAAAAEVSQCLRNHETTAPLPNYARQQGPTPAKVRAVENQAPIATFMKQLSSAKVIKRPPRASQGKNTKTSNSNSKPVVQPVAPVRTSIPSGKTFQFKKKSSSGNLDAYFNKENTSFGSNSSFMDTSDESTLKNENFEDNNASGDQHAHVPELFNDMPFSRFNSSRVLLTESQEQRLNVA